MTMKPMMRHSYGNGAISEDLFNIPERLSNNFLELRNDITELKSHAKEGELSDKRSIRLEHKIKEQFESQYTRKFTCNQNNLVQYFKSPKMLRRCQS